MQRRFERLVKRYGCKIVPIATRVNGKLGRRPDIMGVERHGEFVMVIPRRMYGFPNNEYTDLGGRPHPDFFQCEQLFYRKFHE